MGSVAKVVFVYWVVHDQNAVDLDAPFDLDLFTHFPYLIHCQLPVQYGGPQLSQLTSK